MAARSQRTANLLNVLLGILLSALLAACGGSGGDTAVDGGNGDSQDVTGDGGGAVAPVLTKSRVAPLEAFSVLDASLVAGDTGVVRFVGNGGFDISLQYIVLEDGRVDLVAPAPFDLPLDAGERTVDVFLDGVAADAALTIEGLPQNDAPAGTVLYAYIAARLDLSDDNYFALDDLVFEDPALNTVEAETIFDYLDDEALLLEEQLFLLDEYLAGDVDRIEFPVNDSETLTLGEPELQMLDGLLLSLAASLDVATPGSALASSAGSRTGYRLSGDEARAMFSRILRDAKTKGVAGGKVFLGVMGGGVALVVLVKGGVAVTAIGGAAGIALYYLSTLFDMGLSSALDGMISSLSSAEAPDFSEARATMRTLVDGLLAWCGALPGFVGSMCTGAGGASSMETAVTSMAEIRCEDDPSFCDAANPPGICAVPRSRSSLSTVGALPLVQPRCVLPPGESWPSDGDDTGDGIGDGTGDGNGADDGDSLVEGFYAVRLSGAGWRKRFGGYAHYIDGYHHFPIRLADDVETPRYTGLYWEFPLEHDLSAQFATWRDDELEGSAAACEAGPPICPCALPPDIWVSGPQYELQSARYDSLADLEQQIANPALANLEPGAQYQWVYDTDRRYEEAVAACGG